MPFFFDATIIILIPAIVVTIYAQYKVQSTFNRYLQVPVSSGLTGAQVARQLMERAGIHDVRIETIGQDLADHYDPRQKVLRLSPRVYQGSSIAALGVAAHETGHAIQHDVGYLPLEMRSAIVPVANFGSNLAFPLLLIGLFLGLPSLAVAGVYLFAAVVVFYLITLPVEFNASGRAVVLLEAGGYVSRQEVGQARKVLSAAALTYVAAALTALLNLVRMLLITGMLGGRDE
ncbi:MAG: zinc metallopeptidase [Clostridia bacterium]|nr:MAG: zinc metallopeptidase [Clostridia bacterium]